MERFDYTGRDNLEVMAEAVTYNEFLVNLVKKSAESGQKVVDFGAGQGTFSAPMASAGFDLSCVEVDPVLSKKLRAQGFDVVQDIDELSDHSVDYVYSLNVLEHIDDDIAALSKIGQKIRPQGKLLIYVPAFNFLFSSMDRKVGHVRRYRRSELIQKLKGAGFRIQEAKYTDSLGFLATVAFKIFGSKEGNINRTAIKIYDRWIFPLNRWLDPFFQRLFGKNVYVVAVNESAAAAEEKKS